MARQQGVANVAFDFEVQSSSPLDTRTRVDNIADLTNTATWQSNDGGVYLYEGLKVYVLENKKTYCLKDVANYTTAASWEIDGAEYDDTALQAEILKKAEGYIETTTKTIHAGDMDVLQEGDEITVHDTVNDVDVSGTVDATGAATLTVNGKEVVISNDTGTGEIVVTGAGATDIAADITLKHDEVHLIDSRLLPKGAAVDTVDKLGAVLNVKENQGQYSIGDTIAKDTPLEEIIRKMLSKTNYPNLIPPTATLTAPGTKLLETGATANVTFTITFNAGKIEPQYSAASALRSGPANAYALNGNEKAAPDNTFEEVVSATNATFGGYVKYDAGVQPKDDEGGDYDSPLVAGQVTTNTITYEFVDALYANTANINAVSKLALISKGAGSFEFKFPPQTATAPHEWHVPASWNVSKVEFYNTNSGKYETFSNYDTGATTHNDAAGNSVNYVTYRDNRNIAAGAMDVKITFS